MISTPDHLMPVMKMLRFIEIVFNYFRLISSEWWCLLGYSFICWSLVWWLSVMCVLCRSFAGLFWINQTEVLDCCLVWVESPWKLYLQLKYLNLVIVVWIKQALELGYCGEIENKINRNVCLSLTINHSLKYYFMANLQ